LLIGLWVAWRWAPFIPHLDLSKLKAALRPLFDPHFEPFAVLTYLTYWLLMSEAIAALVTRQRSLELLLSLIAAVLVGRLIVANQAFVPSELLALMLLLPMVVLMHRMTPGPKRVLLVAAVLICVLAQRLTSHEMTPDAPRLDLWPFLGWLEHGLLPAIQSIDWVELFATLFAFGALMWVIKYSGAPIVAAVIALVGIALAIELVQLWLLRQTASITDPLIALAVGLSFGFVDSRFRSDAISQRGRIP
jgi:VanZ family protein